jgi:ADP-heptose:LPS heptosyltransferase
VFERAGNIHRYDQEIADFADTAAIIDQMDLVISVDSAVAHLAGALGKPVWVLLSPRHDFRWLLEREDSPWYASARLFRRARDGGWSDCIERLGRELRRLGYGGGSIP